MLTTSSTATETATEEEEVRPQFLVRTSHFLKKVSTLRPMARRKSEARQPGDCGRTTRSTDFGSKALADIDIRPSLDSHDHSAGSGEDSPMHLPLPNAHPCMTSSNLAFRSSPFLQNAVPRPDGPRLGDNSCTHSFDVFSSSGDSGNNNSQNLLLPNSYSHNVPPSPRPIDGLPLSCQPSRAVPTTFHSRSQTLPSQSSPDDVGGLTFSSSTLARRTVAPRLATLPPPMMAQYATGGVARLTPSLVTRQPPMPLLHLPTLPPPSPIIPLRPARPRAPLRSVPALPMQGPSETDLDADHENASLEEEDEDEDVEGNGDGMGDGGESEQSGDEDDGPSTPPSASIAVSGAGAGRLPRIDTTRFSVSFADAGPHSSTQRTPRMESQAGPHVDYFSSKSPDLSFSPSRTPRLADYHPNSKAKEKAPAVDGMAPMHIAPLLETPRGSPRPGIYHHASKSMVDLMSLGRKDKDKVISPKLSRSPPQKTQALGMHVPSVIQVLDSQLPQESPDDVITSPMLRRRRSLPSYEPSSDPPPYPDPLFQRRGQMVSQPHEDEGREHLPQYSNTIYLAGAMPRKMEFTSPGVQAKDRKWRRVYCVLEGTSFRIYKCPPAASGVSAIEHWWENKVGVGDITSVSVSAVTASGMRVSAVRERRRDAETTERIPKILEDDGRSQELSPEERLAESQCRSRDSSPHPPSTKSRLALTSKFLRRQRSKSIGRLGQSGPSSNSNSTSRLSIDSRLDNNTRRVSHTSSRRSMDTLASSNPSRASSVATNATSSTTLTVPSPLSTSPSSSSDTGQRSSRHRFHSHSSIRSPEDKGKDKEISFTPNGSDLICQYSLQNAESGLASDYLKRKNVVRVRMEGEQFLLQTKDVAAVIDWIEGIQMGTNVALDLDERPMPRGPIFPRRRRRRPRRPEPPAVGESTTPTTRT